MALPSPPTALQRTSQHLQRHSYNLGLSVVFAALGVAIALPTVTGAATGIFWLLGELSLAGWARFWYLMAGLAVMMFLFSMVRKLLIALWAVTVGRHWWEA
ncbi:hypothetical protein AUR64_05280 [Haloprofundus marisrubri]|uniref:Uncharacterized protein n=1 Tax=Haloprofundus marisrubri TaxID=1514971 RepID=A0A0W1RCG2_9EURY|nr:hypothetical protein [Haloprofundus marisrubri]KTG11124.1 hypothetical protein AUR64_05280 [Haloprofundus marisrubri]